MTTEEELKIEIEELEEIKAEINPDGKIKGFSKIDICQAELKGIQEGRAEERERTLKVIDKFKKEACSCSKMDGICKSCDEWDRLITKIQEKKE